MSPFVLSSDWPILFKPKEAAEKLRISENTLRKLILEGQIRKVGVCGDWRVPVSELIRFSTPAGRLPEERTPPPLGEAEKLAAILEKERKAKK